MLINLVVKRQKIFYFEIEKPTLGNSNRSHGEERRATQHVN